MRPQSQLHRLPHRQIPQTTPRSPLRSSRSHPLVANPRGRHIECDRGVGPRRVHLRRNSSSLSTPQVAGPGDFQMDGVAIAAAGAIWRIQRSHKQINWFLLFFLGGGSLQHGQHLLQKLSFSLRSFTVFITITAVVHLILLPRPSKRRPLGQTRQKQRYLPHLLRTLRTLPQLVNHWHHQLGQGLKDQPHL